MNLPKSIRSFPCIALIAFALTGVTQIGLAQSITPKSTGSPSPAAQPPGVGGSSITVSGMPTPMLQGVISADENKAYMAFQQQINEDPAIKELNAKVAKLTKEIQQVRGDIYATREKLIAANPEMKKIQDKIMASMQSRMNNGPIPMPASGVPMMPTPKSN